MYKATALGNLVADAEQRVTPNGKSVINFRIASNERRGEEKETTYISCSIWGKRAESEKLAAALTKGTKVYVDGQPRNRAYAPKDGGEPKVDNGIFVDTLEFCGGGNGGNTGGNTGGNGGSNGGFDDDIPF